MKTQKIFRVGFLLSIFFIFSLYPCQSNAQSWYLSTDLGSTQAKSISAVDSGNVWAILGGTSGEGKIYYYNGSEWTLQTTLFPGGSEELFTVEALDSTHVWAGGEGASNNPLIYFFDGISWAPQTEMNGSWLDDIYAADESTLWSVGGNIYVTWDGGADWEKETTGTFHQVAIDGDGSQNNVWAIGGPYASKNQILFRKGIWEVQTDLTWAPGTDLRDICVISSSDVWAAGEHGYILHYDAFSWSLDTMVSGKDFHSLAARDTNNVWAGTVTGEIFYCDGSNWIYDSYLGGSTINNLSVSADEVWACDNSGQIFRFGAATPTPVGYHTPSPTVPPTCTPSPTSSPSPTLPPTATPPPTPPPTPTPWLPPTPDCGCVGSTQTFYWGETITEDCTLNGDLTYYYTCFTVGTDNITIEGDGYTLTCLVRDNNSYGIYLNGRNNVTIRNIGIEHFNEGIYARDGENIDILNSVISNNQWWIGIYFHNVNNSTISGNILDGNGLRTGGEAIRLSESSFNQITGNTIENNGYGFYLLASSNENTIANNEVTANEKDGLLIKDSNDNTLEDNKFCSNAWTLQTTYDFSDIRIASGTGNNGSNNFCDNTYDYDDTGTTGCTFPCFPQAVVGDYDGDGTTDLAIWRATSALWKIRNLTTIYFGTSTDEPVPQDYDGDGAWDVAYFRPSNGLWKVRNITRIYFGNSSDTQVPADYDGDGTCDFSYFRSSTNLWNVRGLTRIYFGTSSDEPIPDDYDGDGSVDPTFFRASNGLWKVRNFTSVYFGTSTDTLVPGDYDGDGTADFAWFRPTNGLWKIKDLTRLYFGTSEDVVIPGDYDGDGACDYGYFRPSSILWKAKDITRVYFGQSSDIQVTNPD